MVLTKEITRVFLFKSTLVISRDSFFQICQGYAGDGFDCTDINECLTNNGGCSANARCINRNGGFQCICDDGFSGEDGFTCSDIDECTEDPTLCENGICLNDQVFFF